MIHVALDVSCKIGSDEKDEIKMSMAKYSVNYNMLSKCKGLITSLMLIMFKLTHLCCVISI